MTIAPGGWQTILNARVAKALVIGTLALGGGVSNTYGQLQDAHASHYCEAKLTATSAKGVTTYSCLNPLENSASGAVLGNTDNIIVVSATPSPVTRLNICTAATSTTACSGNAAGTNVGSGVVLNGSKRILSLSQTGSLATPTSHGTNFVVLAPRNYPSGAKNRLNFTFQSGSGQTANGLAPAFVRIEILPCNIAGVGC